MKYFKILASSRSVVLYCISLVYFSLKLCIQQHYSFRSSGNLLLIGPIGSQLSDLAALALYMLEYPIHTIDCSYRGSFLDGLRSAVRRAGCDGKTTTIIIKVC